MNTKMLKKVFLISIISLSSQAHESSKGVSSCVEECVKVISIADRHIQNLDNELTISKQLNDLQSKQINTMDDEIQRLNAWYRNPLTTTLIGVILGGILMNGRK